MPWFWGMREGWRELLCGFRVPGRQAPQASWRLTTTPTPSMSSGTSDQLVLTLPSCNFGNRNAFPGKHLGCSRIWLKNKYAASSFLSSGCEKFLEFLEWYLISWDERMGRLFGAYLLPLLSYLLSQLMRLSRDRWRPEWLTNLDFTGFPGVWFFFWLSMKEEGDI